MESILVHTSWQHFSEGQGCFPELASGVGSAVHSIGRKVAAGGVHPCKSSLHLACRATPGHGSLIESPKGKCRPMAPGPEGRDLPRGRSFRQPEVGSSRPGTLFGGEGSLRTNPQRVSHRLEAGARRDSVPPASGWSGGPGSPPGWREGMAPTALEAACRQGAAGARSEGTGRAVRQTQSTRNLRLQTTKERRGGQAGDM